MEKQIWKPALPSSADKWLILHGLYYWWVGRVLPSQRASQTQETALNVGAWCACTADYCVQRTFAHMLGGWGWVQDYKFCKAITYFSFLGFVCVSACWYKPWKEQLMAGKWGTVVKYQEFLRKNVHIDLLSQCFFGFCFLPGRGCVCCISKTSTVLLCTVVMLLFHCIDVWENSRGTGEMDL